MLIVNKKFVNYAHICASSYAPQNTMVAFRKRIELKVNRIELVCPYAWIVNENQIMLTVNDDLEVRLWWVSSEYLLIKYFGMNISGMTVGFLDRLIYY